MVCPNCKSNDIIELQDKHFCINCGKLIELITKKRSPGRPKAERLDKPTTLSLRISPNPVAIAIDTPDSSTDEGSISEPSHPERVAKLAETKSFEQFPDILPDLAKAEADITSPTKSRISSGNIIGAAWSEPWQGGPARILIFCAILTAAIAGSGVAAMLLYKINFTGRIALAGLGLVGLAIALLFGVANTERAAFALRRYDHRPIPRSWLFGGALAALGRQALVLMACLLESGILITLGYYLKALAELAGLVQPYLAVALLSGYFIISLLLLAVWVKTGLGIASVELGRMTVARAINFGWRSVYRHPELIGTRLVAVLWLGSSLAGIITLAYLAHLYASAYDPEIFISGASVLAFTAVLLSNFGAVGWRQASYREIVIADEPTKAIAMLSGHHNGAPSRIAKLSYVFVVIMFILSGIGAILSSFYR